MSKRGITPVVAVILLIVMTVGIAAFTFMWLQDFLNKIKEQAGRGAEIIEKIPQFTISFAAFTNNTTITFIIYNQGKVPIDLRNAVYVIVATDKVTGEEYKFVANNGTAAGLQGCDIIEEGDTKTCKLTNTNDNFNTIVNKEALDRYSFSLSIIYNLGKSSREIS